MGRTVTTNSKIRRQRRMTILLTPQQSPQRHVSLVPAVETSSVAPAPMDLQALVGICHANWSRWCKQVHQERLRCLGETSQYPTGTNIAALMDTETLQHRMDQVKIFFDFCTHLCNIDCATTTTHYDRFYLFFRPRFCWKEWLHSLNW